MAAIPKPSCDTTGASDPVIDDSWTEHPSPPVKGRNSSDRDHGGDVPRARFSLEHSAAAAPGRHLWSDAAESDSESKDLRPARSLGVAMTDDPPQPPKAKTAVQHLIDGTGMFSPKEIERRFADWDKPRGFRMEDSEATLCGAPDSRATFERFSQDGKVTFRLLQRDHKLMEFPNTRAPSPPPGPPGYVAPSQMCEAHGRGRGVVRSLGAALRGGGRAGGGRADIRMSIAGPTSKGAGEGQGR